MRTQAEIDRDNEIARTLAWLVYEQEREFRDTDFDMWTGDDTVPEYPAHDN